MIQTINPYNTAKTAEIMSRYRPIAPKPEVPVDSSVSESMSLPQNISKSPYLRNVWAHLQARPTRTRKRGRTSFAPSAMNKRSRTCLQGLIHPYQIMNSAAKSLSVNGFSHDPNVLPQVPLVPGLVPIKCGLDAPVATMADSVTLPLLGPSNAQVPVVVLNAKGKAPVIDLNTAADQEPEGLDYMPNLQEPVKPRVIAPTAIRPIGSVVSVKSIILHAGSKNSKTQEVKGAAEVEKEVEAEAVPAIVSDSCNKVRLANSAYKEMVGQPECCWLDCLAACKDNHDDSGNACKRIGGQVVLQFEDSNVNMLLDGFTCWVKIEWERCGKKISVCASCDAVKMECKSKDYQYLWRFHTGASSNI